MSMGWRGVNGRADAQAILRAFKAARQMKFVMQVALETNRAL